jgi:hypothetical protein
MKDGSLLADAIKVAKGINDTYEDKARALCEIVRSYNKVAESSNDQTLYDKAFGIIELVVSDADRDLIQSPSAYSKGVLTS